MSKKKRDPSKPERQCGGRTKLAVLMRLGGSVLNDLISDHKAPPFEGSTPPHNFTTLRTSVLIREPFGGQTII